MKPQKVRTFLWYESRAEEAAELYCSLFEDSRILEVFRHPEGSHAPAGSVMTVTFQLAGVQYVALNGGPYFKLNEAVSLSVDCDSQAEVDRLWDALLANGGQASQCGWLKDKFGLSWQIIPSALPRLLSSGDAAASGRVMQAMLQMVKLDVAALEHAATGA